MQHKSDAGRKLNKQEGKQLLKHARRSLERALDRSHSKRIPDNNDSSLNEAIFQQKYGTFVTLKQGDRLRGCIGTLTPSQPISRSIPDNAINAAFHDPRFKPLTLNELQKVKIEISILTVPKPLVYDDHHDLLTKIRPKIDGVILTSGDASATFLPQVWKQLKRTEDFLSQLCLKAGLPSNAWQASHPAIAIYQVQYFEE
jgi:AmmeMemoRadiSam system protein A